MQAFQFTPGEAEQYIQALHVHSAGEQLCGSTWPLLTCGEHLWQRVAWRDPHLLHLLQRHSAAWPRSPASRFKKWDLQWEQCGAQLCLQDFRDDIITPEAEQSGATGRQRDVSSAIHQGQLIQHQHWAHCGAMQCTSLTFFLSGFFFSELLFEE